MSERDRLADEFRADLLAREKRATDAIANAYRKVLVTLNAELDRITNAIEEAVRAGEPLSTSLVWQERRLERLRNEALEALANAGAQAVDLIEDAQLDAIRLAQSGADNLIAASLGVAPAQVPVAFAGLPTGSVEAIVAAVQPSTPLQQLLVAYASDAAEAAADRLMLGVATGQNPRRIAAAIRADLQAPMWKAERLARTEVIRAHREATVERYRANGSMVEGWTWYAQVGSCCVACLAMHGTKHSLDDRLDGHPNCRCIMLPTTVSWADLGYPGIDDEPDVLTGDAIVGAMTQADLAERFGPGVAQNLTTGRLQLGDLVERTSSPEWGTMRRRRSLASALATTA